MENNNKDKSLAISCVECFRCMALLSIQSKNKSNWKGKKHVSDIIIYATICRSCNNNNSNIKPGSFVTVDYLKFGDIYKQVGMSVTGKISRNGLSKAIPVSTISDIFSIAPPKYQLVMLTGKYGWPIDRNIPDNFV